MKRGAYFELRQKHNVALFSANSFDGVHMWRNLLLNNYVNGGASQINSAGSINAVGNITSITGNVIATAGKFRKVFIYYRYIDFFRHYISPKYIFTESEDNSALSGKSNQLTTNTKPEVDSALNAKSDKFSTYTKTEVDSALSGKAHQLTTYTKSGVNTQLYQSVNNGELRRFHVEATERALILDRTAIHLAVSDTMIPTGTGIIMTMDQTSGVVINEIVKRYRKSNS